jgi:hypothetical protein
METLEQRFREPRKSGCYRLAEMPAEFEGAVQAASLALYRVDARPARTRSAVLGLLSRTLAFPSWFGRNWDALEDCLTDLSWIEAPGLVIVIEGFSTYAKADPDGFAILLDIFKSSAEYWRGEGRPFWVVLAGKPAARLELPVFVT